MIAFRPLVLFTTLCLAFVPGHAQVQVFPGQASPRGGGTLQTCDTSMHVGIETTILDAYQCSFLAVIDPGNTTVGDLVWSYFNGSFEQGYGNPLPLSFPGQQQYPVCVTVNAYDELASQPCSTTVCDLITPLPDEGCSSIAANFTIGVVENQTITFQDLSYFADGIEQTIWSFGDGSSIATSPTNTFSGSGPFEICLTVIGPAPTYCTSTLCQWLYLGPGDVECAVLVDQGYALLQYENLVGVWDTSLTSGMYSRVDWDFGDGALATGNVAVHTYANGEGAFQLCGTLKAWGPLLADTCSSTMCQTVYTSAGLGLHEGGSAHELGVHPNPFSGWLTMQIPANEPGLVTVIDACGREMHRSNTPSGTPQWRADLSALPAGVYSLRWAGTHTSHVARIVRE